MPHVWNDVTKTFLTFEDEQSIQERIDYVKNNNLGGVLIWVMRGDYDYDEEKQEYTVGDTLTTMLYDQLTQAGPTEITSDFDVDFGGKYDHPNYYYSINITNHTGEALKGFTLALDLPKSAIFQGSYGGGTPVITDAKAPAFQTVTIQGPAWKELNDGESMELTGSIKLNFAGVKNFKLNGKAMKSEVEAELARLQRLGVEVPDIVNPPEKPEEPDEPVEELEDTCDNTAVYTAGDTVVYQGKTYV